MLPTDSGVDLIISGNIKICTDVYKCINGADDGIRTHDINLGKVALYP